LAEYQQRLGEREFQVAQVKAKLQEVENAIALVKIAEDSAEERATAANPCQKAVFPGKKLLKNVQDKNNCCAMVGKMRTAFF
jgi:hypothetical protein